MNTKKKLKHFLINLSILFFSLSLLTSHISSTQDKIILETKSSIPDYLFDIEFTLYKSQLGTIEQLQGYATFENFGAKDTTVQYRIILYNDKVQKIAQYDDTLTVQTEEYLTVNFDEFKNLDLKPGKYTVVLSTLYDEDVKDIFVQDFYIANFFKPSVQLITFITFSVLIFLALFFVIFDIKKAKTKKEKSEPIYKRIVIREYEVTKNNKRKLKK